MQCANLMKKRSLEAELEPWSCRAKRMCLEAELQLAQCPMEISNNLSVTNQQQEQQVSALRSTPPPPPPLCCPRCLGGEPGHINHITGH